MLITLQSNPSFSNCVDQKMTEQDLFWGGYLQTDATTSARIQFKMRREIAVKFSNGVVVFCKFGATEIVGDTILGRIVACRVTKKGNTPEFSKIHMKAAGIRIDKMVQYDNLSFRCAGTKYIDTFKVNYKLILFPPNKITIVFEEPLSIRSAELIREGVTNLLTGLAPGMRVNEFTMQQLTPDPENASKQLSLYQYFYQTSGDLANPRSLEIPAMARLTDSNAAGFLKNAGDLKNIYNSNLSEELRTQLMTMIFVRNVELFYKSCCNSARTSLYLKFKELTRLPAETPMALVLQHLLEILRIAELPREEVGEISEYIVAIRNAATHTSQSMDRLIYKDVWYSNKIEVIMLAINEQLLQILWQMSDSAFLPNKLLKG